MREIDLRPDCRNCEALCCILLPFDAGPAFGFDKAAGVVCRHLGAERRCTIHASLAARGFSGCAAYSCLGAGQRVTHLLIAGQNWRDDPVRRQGIEDGFRALRLVHEAHAMLTAAKSLGLPPIAEADRLDLLARLDAGRDWTAEALAQAMADGGILPEVRLYLAGLRDRGAVSPPHR